MEFMRTLLTAMLKYPVSCDLLQVLIVLCDSPSMYLVISRQLPAIIAVAVRQLEVYTLAIDAADQENYREIINYEEDVLGARVQ